MNKLLLVLSFVMAGAPALAQGPVPPTPIPTPTPMPMPSPSPSPSPGGTQAPGLYVQVLDGMVALSNPAGSQVFSAGQFGFTPNFQTPPVILPQNPGLKFNPPPVFNSSGPEPSASGPSKGNTVDCEVR